MLEIESGSTRSYFVHSSLWKRPWTFRQTHYLTNYCVCKYQEHHKTITNVIRGY